MYNVGGSAGPLRRGIGVVAPPAGVCTVDRSTIRVKAGTDGRVIHAAIIVEVHEHNISTIDVLQVAVDLGVAEALVL